MSPYIRHMPARRPRREPSPLRWLLAAVILLVLATLVVAGLGLV